MRPPQQEAQSKTVQIDAATRRNLELTAGLSGGRAGSLLDAIDHTVTAAGARLLERRIASPSRELETVADRLEAVAFAVAEQDFCQSLRSKLRSVPDMDRALSRLSLDRGGPRDLTALRAGLTQAQEISAVSQATFPRLLADAFADLAGHDALNDKLEYDLIAEPPKMVRDGGFIAQGSDGD